ncbi:MAG: hypothetical protein MN733_34620 [Nitrososphaera sp.]|nr:hypothetical protein [Nitrososphaera sp.]
MKNLACDPNNGGKYITSYHIDSELGLYIFAEAIKTYLALETMDKGSNELIKQHNEAYKQHRQARQHVRE